MVGTFEERHVLRHPLPAVLVGDGLPDAFRLHRVEVVDVVAVVVVVQQGGTAVGVRGRRLEVADGIDGQRLVLAGILQHAVPVGRGVDVGEGAAGTCAQHDAFYRLDGRKEHALSCFLAVDVYFYQSSVDAEHGLDVVDGVGLILAQSAKAGTALAAHLARVGQFDTRAGRAVLVEEFYLQQSRVVLPCAQVELDTEFSGGWYLALHAGIVEGIAVAQCEPPAV